MKEMHKYAAAWYDEIIGSFEDQQKTLKSFFRIFPLKIDDKVQSINI
jgi:hypothetical protein